jgi:hypothetical protein
MVEATRQKKGKTMGCLSNRVVSSLRSLAGSYGRPDPQVPERFLDRDTYFALACELIFDVFGFSLLACCLLANFSDFYCNSGEDE